MGNFPRAGRGREMGPPGPNFSVSKRACLSTRSLI